MAQDPNDPIFRYPDLKPVPIPEAEVLKILKDYLASLPLSDRMSLGMELVRCSCRVCSFLRGKIDPRL